MKTDHIAIMQNSENELPSDFISPIVLPSGRVLLFNECEKFLKWQKGNKYFGKHFSILGDSISTLDGYNPPGYNLFYTGEKCDRANVHEMADTWWGMVINYFGGELLVNNSWSGSQVAKIPKLSNEEKSPRSGITFFSSNKSNSTDDELFPSGCSNSRTSGLHNNTTMPDVIIVYLGTNDWARAVQPEIKHTKSHYIKSLLTSHKNSEITDETVFSVAYSKMLRQIKQNYPNAEVWCCTLNTTFMSSDPTFVFPYSFGGVHMENYNRIISNEAGLQNCRVIDLYSNKLPYESIDGSHPSNNGMKTLATMVIRSIADSDGERFLNCTREIHSFRIIEELTGRTEKICSQCAKRKTYYSFPNFNIPVQHSFIPVQNVENQDQPTVPPERKILDFVDFDPEATYFFFSEKNGVILFSERKQIDIIIKKSDFRMGRESSCDLYFDASALEIGKISRFHARIIFDVDRWFICDTNSSNGTWLNGNKLESDKWYLLHYDDEIDFAHQEKFIFFRTYNTLVYEKESDTAITLLELAMNNYHDSGYTDNSAFNLIIYALTNAPLYIPVDNVSESMSGDIYPNKLASGNMYSKSNNSGSRIRTIVLNEKEIIPLFTSKKEVNIGLSFFVVCMMPHEYLPDVLKTGIDAILDPLGSNSFEYSQKIMRDLVYPIVQKNHANKAACNNTEIIPGQIIGNRYTLKELIGEGSFFLVYRANDKDGTQVAVKVCKKSAMGFNTVIRNRILQEPRILMQLTNPGIPKVIDIIEDESYIFIVRTYYEGVDLKYIIEKEGLIAEEEAVRIAICAANTLDYVHNANPGFIFRDVKPQNIIITNKNEVIIIDFDAAVEINPFGKYSRMGTRGYAAPEQYCNDFDHRVDIYRLGATLHYMLTGHNPSEPPYEFLPITQYNSSLSKVLEDIVNKCLQKDPDDRYQDCGSLISDLENYKKLPLS